MKFTIERDVLHAALSAVSAQTKTKNIPILAHVLIETAGEGLCVTGNCLNSSATYRAAAKVETSGAAALPADRFERLAAGLPEGGQVVVIADEKSATIRCGRATYRLPILPADDFPKFVEIAEGAQFELSATEVARLFKVPVAFAEGPKGARQPLKGVCLHPQNGEVIAVATDGQVLLRDCTKVGTKFGWTIVPPEAAGEIATLARAGAVQISISPTLIAAEAGPCRFVSKLIDGTFPGHYANLIPAPVDGPFVVNIAEMQAALSRLMAAHDPEQRAVVRLKWAPGDEHITIAMATTFGSGEEQISCVVDKDEPREIGFQVDNLKRILAAVPGETIALHAQGPGLPMRFDVPDNDEVYGLVMPCA